MEHISIVILGAGPCGLGAAYRLHQLGVSSFQVFEREDHVGGLSSSFTDKNGFTWDIGGHVFHTRETEMQELFMNLVGSSYQSFNRHAEVRIGTHIVPYPFQYSIAQLPHAMQKICMDGLAKRSSHATPNSFEEWIIQTFGSGMAKYFFFPYNKKLWRYPLSNMDWHWIDEKVATTSELHQGTSWGKNARFFIPKKGGIGTIWTTMAASLAGHITYGMRVGVVDAKKKIITFTNGHRVSYDQLLSTIPLPSFARLIHGVLLPSTQPLRSNGVFVVGVGMQGTVPAPYAHLHWMYTPSSRVPFFRMSVYSNYGHAPQGYWSLLFEVSYDGKKKLSSTSCIADVIAKAKQYGYLPVSAKIVDRFFYAAPIAYPTPTLGRDAVVLSVTDALALFGISSLGRFGRWNYEQGNMDQVCLSGMQWAEQTVQKR